MNQSTPPGMVRYDKLLSQLVTVARLCPAYRDALHAIASLNGLADHFDSQVQPMITIEDQSVMMLIDRRVNYD